MVAGIPELARQGVDLFTRSHRKGKVCITGPLEVALFLLPDARGMHDLETRPLWKG
jgi:hypothetical protein